jgi:hypothetical protein
MGDPELSAREAVAPRLVLQVMLLEERHRTDSQLDDPIFKRKLPFAIPNPCPNTTALSLPLLPPLLAKEWTAATL